MRTLARNEKNFKREKKETKIKIKPNISSVTLLNTRNVLRFIFDGDDSSFAIVIGTWSDTIHLCYEMADGIGCICYVNDEVNYPCIKSGFIVCIVKAFWCRLNGITYEKYTAGGLSCSIICNECEKLNDNNESVQVSQLTMKYMQKADSKWM